jgi:hypothetical protein
LDIKKKYGVGRVTGLEIFAQLFSADAYRPLIGNAIGSKATKESAKTLLQ